MTWKEFGDLHSELNLHEDEYGHYNIIELTETYYKCVYGNHMIKPNTRYSF
jgi:hypothetical protein